MAGIDGALALPSERAQFAALLEMRWRLFLRNMQRNQEKVSFVLWLLGRILVFSVSAGGGALAALIAYLAVSHGRSLSALFFSVFAGWQLLNLFRGSIPQGVEAELYRFPLRFRTYVLLWLSAGALEGLTLLGSCICLGIFIGLVLAGQSVPRCGAVVLLFFALNLLLTRAVFVWLGRMLASRRARDVVLIITSLLSVLPQVMRVQHERLSAWLSSVPLPPWWARMLHGMPGPLASSAIAGDSWAFTALTAWTAVAAVALLIGLRRAFRGDDVHEFSASAASVRASRKTRSNGRDGSLVTAVAGCEWARLRHGGSAIFTALSPLLYVALFGLRLARGPLGPWVLPVAAAYIGLGLRWVNVFGQDGVGVQMYLLAPVPLRTVLLGKNLFAALLYGVQVTLGGIILSVAMHRVDAVSILFTAVWMVFYVCAAFSLGNYRSVAAPTFLPTDKVMLRDARRARRSGGGWMALLLLLGAIGTGAAIAAVCTWVHHAAWAPVMLLPLAVASVLVYRGSLDRATFRGDDIAVTEPLLLRVARTA